MCDRNCEHCDLELDLSEVDETQSIGIEQLLSDSNDTISLIPEDNDRLQRRKDTTD